MWAHIRIDKWGSFEDFERDFISKFWFLQKQKQFENKLMRSESFQAGKTNIENYFLHYYNIMNFLKHPLNMETFLSCISRHLPSSISATLAGALHIKSGCDLEAFLTRLAGNLDKTESSVGPIKELSCIKGRDCSRKTK